MLSGELTKLQYVRIRFYRLDRCEQLTVLKTSVIVCPIEIPARRACRFVPGSSDSIFQEPFEIAMVYTWKEAASERPAWRTGAEPEQRIGRRKQLLRCPVDHPPDQIRALITKI
jgi:hypothetical protein